MQNSQVTDCTVYIHVIQIYKMTLFHFSHSVWHNKCEFVRNSFLDIDVAIGSMQNVTIPNEIKQKTKKDKTKQSIRFA